MLASIHKMHTSFSQVIRMYSLSCSWALPQLQGNHKIVLIFTWFKTINECTSGLSDLLLLANVTVLYFNYELNFAIQVKLLLLRSLWLGNLKKGQCGNVIIGFKNWWGQDLTSLTTFDSLGTHNVTLGSILQ